MTLSATAKAAMFAQETSEIFFTLLTIVSTDPAVTLRLVDNYSDVTSNGETYTGFPFKLVMLSDQDENLPEATLQFDAVDRTMINFVRNLVDPPMVTIQVVLASSPNTKEYESPALTLRGVGWNSLIVTGKLSVENLVGKRWPSEAMTPALFPGLF
jgi:hypothetical protein